MKKIIPLCLAFLLTLFTVQPIAAQSFDWGIVAGLNLSKLKLSGSAKKNFANFNSDNRAGWYFGPKIAFNTALGIGIDAAAQYSQRKLNCDYNGVSETETYRTIEIPINLRYNIGFGKKAGVYIATGPQFGFALQNMKWSNLGSGDNFDKSNMNTTWNIGAGLRLLNHLEIGVGYNFALGKIGKKVIGDNLTGESEDEQLEYKTNTFQVQIAYMF